MTKVLVLYYSSYGHVETLAEAVGEGVAEAGATEAIKRVPELTPEDVAKANHFKLDQDAPIATPGELIDYDAIIFGTPIRFGNMASQMRNFLDQTGKLWVEGALVGKVGSVFTSTGTGGGNETTITSFWNMLAHQGMTIVGLPTAARNSPTSHEAEVARPMAPGRSPAGTNRASRLTQNSPWRASRAGMSRPSPAN